MKKVFSQREIASFKAFRKSLDYSYSKIEEINKKQEDLEKEREEKYQESKAKIDEKINAKLEILNNEKKRFIATVESNEQNLKDETGFGLSELIIKVQTTSPAGLKKNNYVINPDIIVEVKEDKKAPYYIVKPTPFEFEQIETNIQEENLPEQI